MAVRLRDRYVFLWQSVELFDVFDTLLLKHILKNEYLFPKTGYRFLVESTKIETATFPYKTTLSKANVKTNRMGSTKCTNRIKYK